MAPPDWGRRVARQAAAGRGWSVFAESIRGEGTEARRAWRGRYVRRAIALDAAVALVSGVATYPLWFGLVTSDPRPPFWSVVVVPAVWVPAMLVARAYEERFLWVGVEEYRRV